MSQYVLLFVTLRSNVCFTEMDLKWWLKDFLRLIFLDKRIFAKQKFFDDWINVFFKLKIQMTLRLNAIMWVKNFFHIVGDF